MTRQPPAELTAEEKIWAWGQILKDCEVFEVDDATKAIRALAHLGYDGTDPFMSREWAVLCEAARPVPALVSPVKPLHYIAKLYGGSAGIYRSTCEDTARQAALLDAGRGNISHFRPATEEEIDWHTSMGGHVQNVEPILGGDE